VRGEDGWKACYEKWKRHVDIEEKMGYTGYVDKWDQLLMRMSLIC
jgi:hypothetical protein